MQQKNLSDIFEDKVVLYKNLGNCDIGGTYLSELISALKCEKAPLFSTHDDPIMMPLIIGEDNKLHPVFKEDCKIRDPFCFEYEYSPERLPVSFFYDFALDILVVDQTNKYGICHLCYRAEKLDVDYWEVFDDFLLPKANIGQFIRLAQKIQYAGLPELLA